MATVSSTGLETGWSSVPKLMPVSEYTTKFARFASRVLAHRLEFSSSGSTDPEIVLLRILQHLNIPKDEHVAALQTLFVGAADCVQQNTQCLMWAFYPLRNYSISALMKKPTDDEVSLERHLLPAAILLGVRHFYEPILSSPASEDVVIGDSVFCGTPLSAAVRTRQHHLVRRILESWPEADTKRNCLPGAANDETMLQLILDHRKEPYGQDCLSQALNEAAQLGNAGTTTAILAYILKTQSDIMSADFLALPVHYAARYGRMNVLDILYQHGAKMQHKQGEWVPRASPIMLAAWRGDTEMLRWIVERVPDLTSRGVLAAINGDQPESLRILFEAGADLEKYGDGEDNDLFLRCLLIRAPKAFRYLVLEACPKYLDPKNVDRWMSLEYWMANVCLHGIVSMFDVLVDAGVPIDEPLNLSCDLHIRGRGNPKTWTPMHYATASSEEGAPAIVESLHKMGVAKINSATEASFRDGCEPGMAPRALRRYDGMPYGLRYTG